MAFWGWSRTPASNGTADPTINMAEGMSPSAVNDGVRAAMSRLREFGDDIAGAILTTGTASAYAVTSLQVFDTLAHLHGQMIAFTVHATNNATCTLNVDGLGAKPLRSAPSTEIGAGVLVAGSPYEALYNNSDGSFYLKSFYPNPFSVPLGGLMPYVGNAAPNSNFVFPFGQAISRTTYATLFALIGGTFGTGDGSTTFNVPDLRGRFIAGIDNMGGSTAGRITVAGGNFDGTIRGNTGGAENHTLTSGEMPVHTHAASVTDPGHLHAMSTAIWKDGVSAGVNLSDIVITANAAGNPVTVASATTGISVANSNAGSGGVHSILPPAMTLPHILRVI